MESKETAETVADRRRAIFERTLSRYDAAGIALSDPLYHSLIERWIGGELTMGEVAALWDAARAERRVGRQEKASLDFSSADRYQLLAEIQRLTGEWDDEDPSLSSVENGHRKSIGTI